MLKAAVSVQTTAIFRPATSELRRIVDHHGHFLGLASKHRIRVWCETCKTLIDLVDLKNHAEGGNEAMT